MRSSIVSNVSNLNNKTDNVKIKKIRSRTNPIKGFFTQRIIYKSKSFDEHVLIVCKNRNINNRVESNIMNGLMQKRHSLSNRQKEVIEKWKNAIEIK